MIHITLEVDHHRALVEHPIQMNETYSRVDSLLLVLTSEAPDTRDEIQKT